MSNTEALPPLPEPPTPAEWLHHMYSADQMRAYALAALAQPKTIAEWWAAKQAASGEPADLIAGALYDLMGYLTTRDETIRLGATELATPAVDALVAFAAKRGLSLDNPAIADWSKRIAAAAQPAPAPECDSPKLCAVNGACAGQYGTKKQCAPAQPAPARVPLTDEQTMATLIARAIEATHGITTKEAP